MESERHCPACLKPFQQTNKLLCGHVFCSECITKIETLAQKTNTKPVCPVCLCEFTATSKENPHPNSPYHDELVSRSDPKKKKECVDCGVEPTLICKDGCGLFCEGCLDKHHSKRRRTASHKVATFHEAKNTHGVDLGECIIHNLPIISICSQCWPVSEMCLQCGFDDSTTNKTHEHVDIEEAKYETIKENELIENIQKKIHQVVEKKEKVEIEMKKIIRKEEEQLAKIEKLYNDIVQKAAQLKEKLTETVQETFRPKSNIAESMCHHMEVSENILRHSVAMLKEAKEIYEGEKNVTKLYKSAIFAKKVIDLVIVDVETNEVEDFQETMSFSGDILIDEDGARILDEKYGSIISEYEKCVKEIEQLKNTNNEWQNQMDEKGTKLKNAEERIHILENEVIENRKENERFAQIERQKEEENMLSENTMGVDIFRRTWKINVKDYKYQGKNGSHGDGNQQFNFPWGIAVHPRSGLIFIAEASNHRIQVLDENLNFIRVLGSNGSGSGQLSGPTGISVSLDGRIAVCEYSGNRIQVFDENNTVIATIQSGQKKSQNCTQITDFDGFSRLRYVCFDADGNLYVANYSKNRVDKFNRDFEFECSFAQSSLGDTGVSKPHGLCMNSMNEICVVGSSGDKINFYDTNGTFVRTLKIQKVSANVAIVVGPNNMILVSDYAGHQILVYDSTNGNIVHAFGSSRASTSDGQFNGPMGLCFGLNQNLYVCDYNNHRIQMFSA